MEVAQSMNSSHMIGSESQFSEESMLLLVDPEKLSSNSGSPLTTAITVSTSMASIASLDTATSDQSRYTLQSPRSPSIAKPCIFFAKGVCRNGDLCRYQHNGSVPQSPSTDSVTNSTVPGSMVTRQPPPPIIITIPSGHPVYSIDVECVATGIQHNARSIAQVALVDEWSRPVFSILVKQDLQVHSYITELTGLTKEILDTHGLPLGWLPWFFVFLPKLLTLILPLSLCYLHIIFTTLIIQRRLWPYFEHIYRPTLFLLVRTF